MSNGEVANIVYLLMAMLIFGMAAAGASHRAKAAGASGPGAVASLLIWLALVALVTALYFGAQFWGTLISLFR